MKSRQPPATSRSWNPRFASAYSAASSASAEATSPGSARVLGRELRERGGDLAGLGARGARELGRGDRVVGDEEQCLEQPLERSGFHAFEPAHEPSLRT